MTKWEYQVFKFKPTGTIFRGGNIPEDWLVERLNQLGNEGWEAFGVFTSCIAQGATNEVAVMLKRARG